MLCFTQDEWEKNKNKGFFSKTGLRKTFAPNSKELLIEGIHFVITGDYELTKDNVKINHDGLEISSDDENCIEVYVETWFDVDKKFGTNTVDENTWINLYLTLNVIETKLTAKYVVDSLTGDEWYDYEPTTAEKELFLNMIKDSCKKYYNQTIFEFIRN